MKLLCSFVFSNFKKKKSKDVVNRQKRTTDDDASPIPLPLSSLHFSPQLDGKHRLEVCSAVRGHQLKQRAAIELLEEVDAACAFRA